MNIRPITAEDGPLPLFEDDADTCPVTVVVVAESEEEARARAHVEEWCEAYTELAAAGSWNPPQQKCYCPIPEWPIRKRTGVVVIDVDWNHEQEDDVLMDVVCGGACTHDTVPHIHIMQGHPDGVEAYILGDWILVWPDGH